MNTDELNHYYVNMINDLYSTSICPLCFEYMEKYKECKGHFRLMTIMSDCRLCIRDKYYIDFISAYHKDYIFNQTIKLEVRSSQYTSSKSLKINLLDLIDEEYEFIRLVQVLNPKLDKLITFI